MNYRAQLQFPTFVLVSIETLAVAHDMAADLAVRQLYGFNNNICKLHERDYDESCHHA